MMDYIRILTLLCGACHIGTSFGEGHLPQKGNWKLLFRQTINGQDKLFSKNEWYRNKENVDNPNFSRLGDFEKFRRPDGSFHLFLWYPELGNGNEWSQTSNPVTKTSGGVDNYKGISTPYTGYYWGGLERGDGWTLLDGSAGNGHWWFAIGSTGLFSGGIPGPRTGPSTDNHNYHVVKKVELYIDYQATTTTTSTATTTSSTTTEPKPTVVSSTDYAHAFRGYLLLENACEGKNPSNYWLSPDGKTGGEAYIILNLGRVTQFNRFKIKNTHNGHSNDRGAKHVGLYTSNSKDGPWNLVAEKLITDARNKGCDVPLEEVLITTTNSQFIKLVINSYYGYGGGLKYLGIDLVPGVSTTTITATTTTTTTSSSTTTTAITTTSTATTTSSTTTEKRNECYDYDIEYTGTGLNNGYETKIESALECQQLCQQTNGCIRFTWIRKPLPYGTIFSGREGECWLKDTSTYTIQPFDTTGLISGPAMCGISGCPQGWTIFGDTCYRLFPQRIATYSSAEKKCQEFGGELVSLETEDENDFVEKMLNEARDDGILSVGASPHESTDIWLSARRPNTGSPFTWKTGPSLVFSDWHAGQPTATGLCMQAVRNSGSFWAWWIEPCDGDSDNAVVCEKKIGVWTAAVWLNDDATNIVTNIEEEAFNTQFAKCPVVQYTRNGAVHSVYVRTSPVPASFNAFAVFTNKWISTNNEMDTDFRLYDNLEDAKSDTEAWTFCNYNDDRPEDDVVGYPRDCGKGGYVGWQWFRMPHHQGGGTQGSQGITAGIGFDIYSGSICPANLEKRNDCYDYDIEYTGTALNNGYQTIKESALECQQLCKQTNGCIRFTWIRKPLPSGTSFSGREGECWLKDTTTHTKPSIDTTGLISGPAVCGTPSSTTHIPSCPTTVQSTCPTCPTIPTPTCPSTPTPTCPPTMTCPTIPEPTKCPTVTTTLAPTCPPIVTCPKIPEPTKCPTVTTTLAPTCPPIPTCPTIPEPTKCPALTTKPIPTCPAIPACPTTVSPFAEACSDKGCKNAFKGLGMCVDTSIADWSNVSKIIDFTAETKDGKCGKDCNCKCFKHTGCFSSECDAHNGICLIQEVEDDNDNRAFFIPSGYSKAFPCDESLDCHCYLRKETITQKPRKSCKQTKKCTKRKGKCYGKGEKAPEGAKFIKGMCGKKTGCKCFKK